MGKVYLPLGSWLGWLRWWCMEGAAGGRGVGFLGGGRCWW